MFQLDPEQAHVLTLLTLRIAGRLPGLTGLIRRILAVDNRSDQTVQAFGLTFPNPVGLAAGYDKDGLAWRGLGALGFGHIEIGTITPMPQRGNPKPRVFRIPEEQAIINRMGFPGDGAEAVYKRLSLRSQHQVQPVLGVNIGKNKDVPNENAAQDYLFLLEKFSPLADYLAVNVSSPNTVGLRRLQARDYLENLLGQLESSRRNHPTPRPILVKLAPDLSDPELDDALEAITRTGMDGVIATNTTTSRDGLTSPLRNEMGGLSGAPVTLKSRKMVAEIHHRTGGSLPVIGVGGIMTPDDAIRMLDEGAILIQVYTGLIYNGPGLVGDILSKL